MQIDREKSQALLDAIRPFAQAAGLGWQVKTITHPHFGPEPVQVFAIDVSEALS
ncbi:MAG: hypothetical protein AB7E24_25260 [Novosphingobium sp.]